MTGGLQVGDVKTLPSTIDGMFPGGLTDEVRDGIVKAPESGDFLTVAGLRAPR